MAMMRAIEQPLAMVESSLETFFADRVARAASHGPSYSRLWECAREAFRGGKRIRPRLLLTAYRGFGGEDHAPAVSLACAYELLHTAFLLHDDVIDGDTVRRGRPNVVGVFRRDAIDRGSAARSAHRWGEVGAILAGDLLLQAATSKLARAEVDAPLRERLLDILDEGVFVTAAGELTDVAFSERIPPRTPALEDVLAMTESKTAAYSVSGPLTSGALLAGAGEEALVALAEFGRLVGIAFQLGDDLLGVFGSEDATGKSIFSDLREQKETSRIAFARGTPRWAEIAPSLGRPDLAAPEAERVAGALEECGARRFVEGLLRDHVDRAVAMLGTPSIPPGLAGSLTRIARSCVGRAA
ncbi:polyprenyl synthetase family protein [Leifsonia sp. C5G2]|uniref:polyprenyl synthetase family protein n=1 Tax=Leifsonia sp. C5G2 TaxID=2735269 RepID=UPI0015856C48|nr:polyprenyl synthetase family protein [Leifsonia sp. C5G2]NUU08559.1 polyprenyl synthetase family protein [Leifsonia sp. C5G2]